MHWVDRGFYAVTGSTLPGIPGTDKEACQKFVDITHAHMDSHVWLQSWLNKSNYGRGEEGKKTRTRRG